MLRLGRPQEAVAAFEEGLKLAQPYAERYPGSWIDRVYRQLQHDLNRTRGEQET